MFRFLNKILAGLVTVLSVVLGFFVVRRSNEARERAEQKSESLYDQVQARDKYVEDLRRELHEKLNEESVKNRNYFEK